MVAYCPASDRTWRGQAGHGVECRHARWACEARRPRGLRHLPVDRGLTVCRRSRMAERIWVLQVVRAWRVRWRNALLPFVRRHYLGAIITQSASRLDPSASPSVIFLSSVTVDKSSASLARSVCILWLSLEKIRFDSSPPVTPTDGPNNVLTATLRFPSAVASAFWINSGRPRCNYYKVKDHYVLSIFSATDKERCYFDRVCPFV